MMSREQNDQLSRVGPGTLMGKLLRRYWAPFLLSSEIPEPDCPPVRVQVDGREPGLLSRQQGTHRADRRILRAIAASRSGSGRTRNAGCAAPITAGNTT